jgi:hypothetical protein
MINVLTIVAAFPQIASVRFFSELSYSNFIPIMHCNCPSEVLAYRQARKH